MHEREVIVLSCQIESTDRGHSKWPYFIQSPWSISAVDVPCRRSSKSRVRPWIFNFPWGSRISALRRLGPLAFIAPHTPLRAISERQGALWGPQQRGPRFESWFYYRIVRWFGVNYIICLRDSSALKMRIVMPTSKAVMKIQWDNASENHFLNTKVLYSFVFIEIMYYLNDQ